MRFLVFLDGLDRLCSMSLRACLGNIGTFLEMSCFNSDTFHDVAAPHGYSHHFDTRVVGPQVHPDGPGVTRVTAKPQIVGCRDEYVGVLALLHICDQFTHCVTLVSFDLEDSFTIKHALVEINC